MVRSVVFTAAPEETSDRGGIHEAPFWQGRLSRKGWGFMKEKRVVVTGYGALSCVGNGVEALWSAVSEGRCGLGAITRFDTSIYRTKIAGEIKDFDITPHLSVKEAKRMERFATGQSL